MWLYEAKRTSERKAKKILDDAEAKERHDAQWITKYRHLETHNRRMIDPLIESAKVLDTDRMEVSGYLGEDFGRGVVIEKIVA